jgi:outer membrane protein
VRLLNEERDNIERIIMNRTRMAFVSACLACALVAGQGWCADIRIAVVDMSRVMKAFNETKSAESLMEKQIEDFEAEQKEMLATRDKLKKEFDAAQESAKDKALSDKERENKRDLAEVKFTALRDCELKFRETMTQRQKQLNDQKVRIMRRIVAKLRDIISKYAAEKKYTLVLDLTSVGMSGVESIIYAQESTDITEEVLKIINVGVPEKADIGEAQPKK